MDFNVSKMAAVVYVLRDGNPHAVDEFMDVFDTPAMIADIEKRYSEHRIFIYPDASGENRKTNNASESDLALLRKAKFEVKVNASNPAVKDRVNAHNAMLCNTYGERRLLINTQKCPKFTQCQERQVYAPDGAPDKKGGFDHGNDGGTYPIVFMFPIVHKRGSVRNFSA